MINCLIVLNCFEFYGYYFNHLDYSSIVSDSNLIFICYYDGYSRNSSLACFRNGHSLLQNYALCYDAITIDAEEGGALTPEQVRVTASKMKLNCLQGSKLLLKQQEDQPTKQVITAINVVATTLPSFIGTIARQEDCFSSLKQPCSFIALGSIVIVTE